MVKRNKYMNVPEIRFKGLDKTWNKKHWMNSFN